MSANKLEELADNLSGEIEKGLKSKGHIISIDKNNTSGDLMIIWSCRGKYKGHLQIKALKDNKIEIYRNNIVFTKNMPLTSKEFREAVDISDYIDFFLSEKFGMPREKNDQIDIYTANLTQPAQRYPSSS